MNCSEVGALRAKRGKPPEEDILNEVIAVGGINADR